MDVFRGLLRDVFHLSDSSIQVLLASSRPSYPSPANSTSPHRLSPHLSCPSAIYPPTSPYAILNTPLYIATDHPSSPHLAIFRNAFPCRFFLADFLHTDRGVNSLAVPGLEWIEKSVDAMGVRLHGGLEAFLEAAIAATARHVIGSTSPFPLLPRSCGALCDTVHHSASR